MYHYIFTDKTIESSFNEEKSIRFGMIEYTKYLNCPDCKKKNPYCEMHRKEVENILNYKRKTDQNY